MKKKLLCLATAFAFAAPLAKGATPKAAEDANSPVTSVDQPAPKVKRAPDAKSKKPAPAARKATPRKQAKTRKKAPARRVATR